MCIRDRNTSTYSPPEDGSRQPTRFSEASRRELAETENLLRVETQHAAPDEAGVCALFRIHATRTASSVVRRSPGGANATLPSRTAPVTFRAQRPRFR